MKKRKMSRSTAVLAACLLAVPTVPELVGGMEIWGNPAMLKPYLAAGLLLGLAHLLLRPLLRMITLPLGCLTLGLSGTAIDIGLIYLTAEFVDGFMIPGFICAAATALLINALSAMFGK